MRKPSLLLSALLASTALTGVAPARAQPLPTGGHVVSGGVAIGTPSGGALAITQSSQNAIVNWQGFSIGQGNRVDIAQPNAQAAILNRVTGSTPSTIAGQLNANGQVYLVNPNGIAITRTGRVNAGGGFVASTLDTSDEDFRAARRQFRGSGASAKVTNAGTITIGRGGYAALIGGQVSNSGTISVPMGKVGLGSGERATLDLSGDGFLQVAVPTNAKGRGALVRSSGTISADGGSVTLTAAAARDMARQAVNLSGTIEARSVSGQSGRITLSGGEGAVRVASTARLDASGTGSETGGRIKVTGGRLDVAGTVDVSGARGGRVSLKGSESLALSGRVLASGGAGRGGRVTATAPAITTRAALIDASGATGGGTVRVGGGRQGGGRLAHAQTVDVDAGTTIRADATRTGGGGDVVVWSDVATRFAGTISATGGREGGDGGQAEVSSKGVLSYDGTTILTAAKGAFGTLLLDPYDITISTGTNNTGGSFTANTNDSVINATTLTNALGTANVTVSTGSAGSQAGTITLAAATPLSWSTGTTLTLQAAGGIALNSDIRAAAGGLTLSSGGTISATGAVSVARFTLASGDWVQNGATLPGFAAGDFRVTGGSFLRAAGGAGTNASPYLLTDIYGVQGMGTSAASRAASYRLAADVDAAGTAAWNGGAGFSPVGTDGSQFSGSLDGAGHTIAGLTIARPGQDSVGLIGALGTGGSVSGLGLVGGSVSGSYSVGGLVGYNNGTVSRSYATGSVAGSGNQVGGLVGSNYGTVSQSYATGSVAGSGSYVGGLVGYNEGTVSQSYATGSVAGSSDVGGLVGYNLGGTVSESYATGSVAGSGNGVGGLVGSNLGGAIAASYWDTQSTGRAGGVGSGSSTGATGLTTAQARDASSYAGWDFSTVWYQAGDLRPILRAEALQVGGVYQVSNLHQLQLMGANLSGSYVLTRDLDAGATAATAASSGVFGAGGFVPVGTDGSRFTGSLSGAGHTITGLTIARPGQDSVGLIGYLGTGGSVTGLGLVGGSVSGFDYVGGLVGSNSGTVSQSYATGSVSGSGFVGGLVGYTNGGTVSQSYATGSVTGSGNLVGGLVGSNYGGTVSQSYATGSVSGFDFVGGLVGYNLGGTVSQSYASGSVSGSSLVGGLVGYNGGTITASYWDTQSTGRAGGVGSGSSSGATGLTTAQARTASSYAGWDFSTVWYQAGDLRPILRSEAVQVGGVYQVSNLHQLQLMGATLSGSYVLTRDLDASATAATAASSGVFGAGGFVPVGSSSSRFTGGLSGAGHTITGLTIARPGQDSVGLIGVLGTGGSVSGLGLVGGSVSGSDYVGGLVGYNYNGTVSQSYATGSVSGSDYYMGGLVGYNTGTVSQSYATGTVSGFYAVGGLVGYNSGTVNQSYATGSVSGDYTVGGLVGISYGTVSQSYATGSVSGSGSSSVGGLVGDNSGTVSQSYATGSVSGPNWRMGGLVGDNSGTVSQSYATGSVSGTGRFVSGLVGSNNNTIAASYWDTQSTGQVSGVGAGSSSGATGLTTAQMQDLASFRTTYAGFDFDSVWAPPNQAGQGGLSTAYYPQLYALSKVVAVTPVATNRVYGDANPTFTASYAGVRAGDFVTTLGTLSTSATAASNVGAYAVTAGGTAVTGAAANGYRIVYVPGTLTVAARPVTLTADAQNRVYGDANPGLTYQVGGRGLANGDTLTGGLATAADPASNVGSYGITQGTLAASSNYAVSYVGANLTVAARPVTLTADAQNRVYGDANPGLTYQVGGRGLANGDTLTGGLATAAGTASNVGAYAITQGSLAASSNYAVSYVGANLTVAARPVTIAADAQNRVYGDANPALTYQVGGRGLANGDTLTGGLTTGATATSNVGAYGITQGTLAASSNYAVTYVGANLTVAARPVTLTADAQNRVYGDANPGLTYQVGGRGLANGDTLTGGLATAADPASNVGAYGITQGTLAASSNYAVTYVGANLTVAARPVTIAADAQNRVYGDANPELTYRIGGRGLANGDTLTGGLTTGATATSNVGAYGITQGTLAASSNYAVTYVGANLTVAARPVTLTADAQNRVYGDANPGLTYQVGGRGLANGDTLTGGLATAADPASNVGAYAITQGTLAASSNYAVSYVGANLTVAARPLTLTADAQNRVYGDANPGLTYRIGGRGLANGDTLTGGFATAAGTASNVGAYAITQGSLAASSNYAVTYVGANLTVAARPVTLTADAQNRVYGDANPGLTYQVGGRGLANGDTLTGGLATAADPASNVGAYGITQGTLAASSNYAVTYVGANLTVAARPLTLTADAQNRVYGDANPGLTYRIGGRGLANGDTLTGGLATAADPASNVGSYAITQGTLAASSNYAVSYVGANLTVAARPLTLTADAQNRVYGDANPGLTYRIGGRGLANGDTLTGGLTTGATATSNVGAYGITQGTLAASSNYAVTYVGANLTVAARPVTLTADAQNRVYGDANPGLTYQVGGRGLANGDTLTGGLATAADPASNVGAYAITQGTLAASSNYAVSYVGANLTVAARPLTLTADAQNRVYGDANPGLTYRIGGRGLANGDTLTGGLTTGATATSNVGAYGITQGTLAASSNYAVTYVGANLTVAARPVTLTADAQNRVYGDANPGLTYQVGGRGLANGDTLTGGLATAADPASNVGAYAITQGTLAASSNYAVSYVGANLTVAARPVTITAIDQRRPAFSPNPVLTYTLGGAGLVNGDALTGTLATQAGPFSLPGRYGIGQGSLGASTNYTLTFEPGVLSVAAPAAGAFGLGAEALASTVVRQLDLAGVLPAATDGPPEAGTDTPIPSPDPAFAPFAPFTGFSDPRFGSLVVCLGVPGGCFPVPASRIPVPASPRPQAAR